MSGLSVSPHLLIKLEPLFAHLFRHCFSYSPLQVIRKSFIRSDSVIRSQPKEYTGQGKDMNSTMAGSYTTFIKFWRFFLPRPTVTHLHYSWDIIRT